AGPRMNAGGGRATYRGRGGPARVRPPPEGAHQMGQSESAAFELVIRPQSVISLGDLADVWRYRELLWTLGARDVSARYKQTALGAIWAILQPVAQMVIFTVVFNRFAGIRSD